MILEITKLHSYKKSQAEGTYLMIEMQELKTRKWYRTYINPNYHNFKRWRTVAREGNQIALMETIMKTENIISADSRPLLLEGRRVLKNNQTKEESLKNLARLGVFG